MEAKEEAKVVRKEEKEKGQAKGASPAEVSITPEIAPTIAGESQAQEMQGRRAKLRLASGKEQEKEVRAQRQDPATIVESPDISREIVGARAVEKACTTWKDMKSKEELRNSAHL